jgi:2-phosphoglycerate kinase
MLPRLIITGIPTSGKTFLGARLAKDLNGILVSTDVIREELRKDERFRPWHDFYRQQDERRYYATTSYQQQWENLVRQSEGLWPGLQAHFERYRNIVQPIIFEGVNLLPHLIKTHLNFPAIALIGRSLEEVLERNRERPRWGLTDELQRLEADAFFYGERPRYKAEAEKYGYPVFDNGDEAYGAGLMLLRIPDERPTTPSS